MLRISSFSYTLLLCFLALLTGCRDDALRDFGTPEDGSLAVVNLEASFSPFAGNNLSRGSVSAPPRGYNTISDIVILTFSAETRTLLDICEPRYYDVKDEYRQDSDASNNSTAESTTKSVSNISFRIPQGEYFIVAVANYGDYKSLDNGTITVVKSSLEKLRENEDFEIDKFTLHNLRSLRVGWDSDEYANNRAMLGYFTLPDEEDVPNAEGLFRTVTINQSNMHLKAWLRRCVSKITVDFDGSALSENISVFIKDIRICDLAADCSLGFGSPNSDQENALDYNNHPSEESDLISTDGSYVELGRGEYYPDWPCITQQSPFIMDEDGKTRKDLHSENSDCLYFYENMQGIREGYDRSPIPNLLEGGVQEGYNLKDGVPYGTFVEVTAHYVSDVDNESHEEDIKYRFMLGKNETDNFDAERNYHYKLTLRFLGKANEYHWHIDYEKEEGFKVPNPWYVSYVYNHDAYLPFDLEIPVDWEIVDMSAKIISNPWYPTTVSTGEGIDSELTDPNYEITPETPAGDESYPYQTGDNKYTGNGFLSLRAPSGETVLTDTRVGKTWTNYYSTNANKINQDYFDGISAGTDSEGNQVTPVNHGERKIIDNTNVVLDGTERERVSVQRKHSTYSIRIPLFTREKCLIKQTGYTGNNPFVGYQRVAKVQLTALTRKKDDHSQTKEYSAKVNVVQVRRVVNPKGVYRSNGNYEPFHVNLKYLTSEGADGIFTSIVSRGPWMAEILGDANFITLDGKQRVNGASRSEIDFTIKFNRMAGGGNKNAIIRIKYHNYTCTHLIFIRQGYDAQAICDGGPVYQNSNASATLWETFNMVGGNKMADDPRDEGSLFKYGAVNDAISSIDNIYKDNSGKDIYYELSGGGFVTPVTLTILNADGSVNNSKNNWKEIGVNNSGFGVARNADNTPMKISHAATMRDFEQLYLTKYIEFGYGILYADGATSTQSSLEMANGWYRDDPSPDKNKKGMRGIFAYYWNVDNLSHHCNAKNIFLPLGRAGYGRRKNDLEEDYNNGKGMLRYGNKARPGQKYGLPFQNVAPLFEFLYRRMGAIYWVRNETPAGQYLEWNGQTPSGVNRGGGGLDLNYFTFDINAINFKDLDYGGDACFVRTVKKSAGE